MTKWSKVKNGYWMLGRGGELLACIKNCHISYVAVCLESGRSQSFIALGDAKRWCEWELAHVIAETICEGVYEY
jgi:hypothetical protein